MEKLPNYLIEENIIPYLSSEDLFYKFRLLSSYYYICARNKILTHFPSEMMITLKKLIELNTKEELTKNFEDITRKTFNEKKVLLLLLVQINFSLIIKKILETNQEQRTFELISFFYVVTKNNNMHTLMEQGNFEAIKNILSTEECVLNTRIKISEVLEEDDIDYDLNEYQTVYESLDRDFLLNDNYTSALYNYLGLLIEFCGTKLRLNEVKKKLELFFQKISETSDIWPKKRKFYEKTIDLVGNSQVLSSGAKFMLNLMKKYDIETELNDYRYEKEEINSFNNEENYDIIKSNRKKLNLVVLKIEQMFLFFSKCVVYNDDINSDIIIEKNIKFKIWDMIIPQGDFLYILSMIDKKLLINENTFVMTMSFLKHNILHKIYKIDSNDLIKKINEEDKDNKQENKIIDNKYKNLEENDNMGNINDIKNDLKDALENTKLAGKEINDYFHKFYNDLENLNSSLL